jgi:hypothetical protein
MAEPAGRLLLVVLVAVAGGVSFSPFDAGLSKISHGQDCLQSVFRKDRSRPSSDPASHQQQSIKKKRYNRKAN